MKSDPKSLLNKYLPEDAVDTIYELMVSYKVHLRISKKRSSKYGDYRPPVNTPQHRISVNHDLNPYSFLITLVHEIAHLQVWESYKNSVKPHGKEWKNNFRMLMEPFLQKGIFPEELEKPLSSYLEKAAASSSNNLELMRLLQKYDEDDQAVFLEDLSAGSRFRIHNGKRFEKKEKLRKRIKCRCLDDGRMYLFNPLARVEVLELN